MNTIGKRLKKFAALVYDNAIGFARAINVNQASVSEWFNDKKLPSAEHLRKILNAGCSLNWLFSGQGKMFADNDEGRKIEKSLSSLGLEQSSDKVAEEEPDYENMSTDEKFDIVKSFLTDDVFDAIARAGRKRKKR